MNFKKIIFSTISLLIITTNNIIYTTDQQNEETRTSISCDTKQSQADLTQSQDTAQIIDEYFQLVTEQTQKIIYTLQQIELILNNNQIQYNNKKISKTQLLSEIKDIKAIIQKIYDFCITNEQKDNALFTGAIFNTAFINYLLPIIQNDVTQLCVDTFNESVIAKYELIKNNLEDAQQLIDMVKNNEKNLETLTQASDDIGLNTLNKIYRYLNTKKLPWYGKTTIDTAQDAAFWGGLGLLTYTGLIYAIQDKFEIDSFGFKFNSDHLPLKKYIGSINTTDLYKSPTTTQDDQEKLGKKLGLVGTIDATSRAYSNPFIAGILGFVTYKVKPHFEEWYKAAEKQFSEFVNYYIKGNNNHNKNSATIAKTYFKDMIGGKDLEKLAQELADYLKNPTRYDRAGITPSTGYLLVGPSQTGKSFFAKALKTLIDETFENEENEVKFFNITTEDVEYFGFNRIFNIVKKAAPCIVFIDELDMYGARRDRSPKNTQELLTNMNGIETDKDKKVIIIAATNKPEELDFALKQKGRFGTVITFDYPTYELRKAYFEKQLTKRNIVLSEEMIDTIAQETDGQTYNMIEDILRQALQLATYQTRPVNEKDFETTLDREIRKIKPNTTISVQEKELIAIYQAGQAAARHILNTNQQIVKITIEMVDKQIKTKEGFNIVHENKNIQHENAELTITQRIKPTRLGFVFTMSKINNHELLSDLEEEKELMALLAGQAALDLVKGTTYHEFGKEDRAKILHTLEKKISQGTLVTNQIQIQAIAAKEALYQRIKAILKNHITFIKTITDELLKMNTIGKKQWEELATNYPVKTAKN